MDAERVAENEVDEQGTDAAKRPRGFAAMTPEMQRAIARRGGCAAHARGTAHEFSPNEAREAGRRGGEAVAKDRAYMSKIGREGARKSAEVRQRRAREKAAAAAAAEKASAETPETAETKG